MKITYVQGDLLAAGEKLIVHGCNARGAYASGFAGAVRTKYPWAYQEYMRVHQEHKLVLGTINWAQRDGMTIGNAITQADYGRDGKQYVSYEAIRLIMTAINASAQEGIPYGDFRHGFDRIAMPMIGAKLGGGDWNVIEKIIEETMTDVQPVVYVLDK